MTASLNFPTVERLNNVLQQNFGVNISSSVASIAKANALAMPVAEAAKFAGLTDGLKLPQLTAAEGGKGGHFVERPNEAAVNPVHAAEKAAAAEKSGTR